jgi:hypothetical protein
MVPAINSSTLSQRIPNATHPAELRIGNVSDFHPVSSRPPSGQ